MDRSKAPLASVGYQEGGGGIERWFQKCQAILLLSFFIFEALLRNEGLMTAPSLSQTRMSALGILRTLP